ncbi:MAG: DNA polymerase III subunit delta, partial [Actinomycetota bacterium]|nr:DNA polymerase III subunit delta [Actinomycetota bacterium]
MSKLADLKSVYLIFGKEELLLQDAVARLKDSLFQVADLDFNLSIFDGDKVDIDEVVAACNMMPFMSERRLVIVQRTDKMSTAALGVLADYAKNPNPETALVLVATKIAKNLRLYKAVDALGGAYEYKAPTKREYPRKVVELFERRGKRVGMDAAEVLVRAIGYDLRRLSIEIEKVVAFVGEKDTLSRHDIEEVMSTTAPTSIFDFLNALGAKSAKESLRLLAALLADGESIFGINAMAVRHVRNLLSIRALLDRGGVGVVQMARELRMADWQAKTLVRQADRFTEAELIDALRAAAEGEAQMKTSRDARLVFERWVLSI